jgi:hypothetical protein
MTAWRRMQDWLVMVLGLLLALAPLGFARDIGSVGAWTCYVVGGLLVAGGLWSASTPDAWFGLEWSIPLLLGGVLIVLPWLVGYSDERFTAALSGLIGTLVVLTSLGELILGPDFAPV